MRQRAPQYFLSHRRRSQNHAQNPEFGFPLANPSHRTLSRRQKPGGPSVPGFSLNHLVECSVVGPHYRMLGFLDNFRQTFHNFQNRRGTFSLAVRYPMEISLPATGRRRRAGNTCGRYFLRIPPPIGSRGTPVQASETNRKSKLFPWIFTARSTLYLVLLSASTSLSCRSRARAVLFTLFKMAFIKNFTSAFTSN